MPEISKYCFRCGTDVSAARRFKDSKGHFFCHPCAARAKSKAAQPAAVAVVPPSHADLSAADTDIFELEGGPPEPPKPRPSGPVDFCPECGRPMGARDICPECAFNRKTGRPVGDTGEVPTKRSAKPCKKCGYDLTGLKTAQCPECGTVSPRRFNVREVEQQTLKKMYMVPLIAAAIGLAVAVAIHLLMGHNVILYAAVFAATLPIAFVTYIMCSMMFIGFDEPIGVTFVRLAAVLAITDAVYALLGATKMPGFVSLIIGGLVYVWMLMKFMELDLEDAWLVLIAMFVMRIVVVLTVLWLFM